MSKYTAMYTLTAREISRFLRVWTQSLIPPIVTSTLFILIFGFSLGSRISDIGGVSYLEFIVPGLLMMGVIMSSYMNTTFSLYLSRFQGNIQEILVAPIPYWHIIASLTIAAVARGLIVGLGILGVALIFTSVPIFNIWIILFFMFGVSLLFAFAGIITALWADSFDKLNVFQTFAITPLTYLGGVFYSIAMLPHVWQIVAKFNPILYMVDGFRYGFLGFSDINPWTSIIMVFVISLIFFIICVQLFRKGYRLRT